MNEKERDAFILLGGLILVMAIGVIATFNLHPFNITSPYSAQLTDAVTVRIYEYSLDANGDQVLNDQNLKRRNLYKGYDCLADIPGYIEIHEGDSRNFNNGELLTPPFGTKIAQYSINGYTTVYGTPGLATGYWTTKPRQHPDCVAQWQEEVEKLGGTINTTNTIEITKYVCIDGTVVNSTNDCPAAGSITLSVDDNGKVVYKEQSFFSRLSDSSIFRIVVGVLLLTIIFIIGYRIKKK